MKFNKLIRDKIPEIIINNNEIPVIHIAGDEEYFIKLKEKLEEEIKQFLEEGRDEELADILEVIYAICDFKHINRKDLEEIRRKKAEQRGGFKNKIILEEIK